ncbi:MAG: hypothetical protein ACLFR8_06760 [Alkalispirochaeta sp.]
MIVLLLVIVALNGALSLYLLLTGAGMWRILVPLPETIAISGALALIGTRRTLRWVVGAILGILIAFSLTEGVFQFIYARSFLPRADIQMISGLLYLLFGEIGELAFVLRPIVFGAIVILFAYGGIAAATIVHRIIGDGTIDSRRVGTFIAVAVLFYTAVGSTVGYPPSLFRNATRSWFDDGTVVFEDYRGLETLNGLQRDQAMDAEEDIDRGDGIAAGDGIATGEDPEPGSSADDDHRDTVHGGPYRFPGIKDRDIYLFALEAYGYATFSRDQLAQMVAPARNRFVDALTEKGYEIRSAYLLSPVAGGFSWLAEATLLTGQWIDSQNAFLQLYEAPLPTLSSVLHEGGYYTLSLKPGTVHGSWPEGWDIFRFEESLVAHDGDFNYVGPWFSYVAITDQFTLWTAHNRIQELIAPGGAAEERPVLAYYQLVSSHTPFNKIPPFIESWDALGDGSVYNDRADEIRYFDNDWGGGTEMDEGYSTAISYVFESLAAYIEEYLDESREPIIIVFGDHQAQRPIREQDAHLSVPIHVASTDPEILARFEAEGFRPGIDGGQRPPHPRMSSFFPSFLRIIADGTDAPISGSVDGASTSGSVDGSAVQVDPGGEDGNALSR